MLRRAEPDAFRASRNIQPFRPWRRFRNRVLGNYAGWRNPRDFSHKWLTDPDVAIRCSRYLAVVDCAIWSWSGVLNDLDRQELADFKLFQMQAARRRFAA